MQSPMYLQPMIQNVNTVRVDSNNDNNNNNKAFFWLKTNSFGKKEKKKQQFHFMAVHAELA